MFLMCSFIISPLVYSYNDIVNSKLNSLKSSQEEILSSYLIVLYEDDYKVIFITMWRHYYLCIIQGQMDIRFGLFLARSVIRKIATCISIPFNGILILELVKALEENIICVKCYWNR